MNNNRQKDIPMAIVVNDKRLTLEDIKNDLAKLTKTVNIIQTNTYNTKVDTYNFIEDFKNIKNILKTISSNLEPITNIAKNNAVYNEKITILKETSDNFQRKMQLAEIRAKDEKLTLWEAIMANEADEERKKRFRSFL